MIKHNGYVIHTPTKCGTNSLLNMLKPLGAVEYLPRHDLPSHVDVLMVRNPLDRMRSMYHHCFKYPPLQRYTVNILTWQRWLAFEAASIWSESLTSMYCKTNPTHVFKLENFDEVLEFFAIKKMSHVNKSNVTHKLQLIKDDSSYDIIMARIELDARTFSYELDLTDK
jgi:hypothetical protein